MSAPPPPVRRRRDLARDVAVLALLAAVVLGFSGGWRDGALAVDGPGTRLWVQHALDLWRDTGRFPYWIDALWAGTPAWALAPSLPVLWLVPLAGLVGADAAVKAATLAGQIVGAWGCFVLARSLWGGTAAPLVAGFAFGLSPLLVAHAGAYGLVPVVWVLAAAPWFAWALRHALEGAGRRYVAAAAGVGAFAVLQQAEHAYALALLGAGFTLVAAATAGRRGQRAREVAVRAGAVVALMAGLMAFWLLPFAALRDAFVLTPPDLVRFHLTEGIAADFATSADAFVARLPAGPAEPLRALSRHGSYLGLVGLVLTGVALLLAPLHDRDRYLTAAVGAAALSLWTSTAGVPLVRSELFAAGGWGLVATIGLVGGLLVGSAALAVPRGRLRVLVVAGGCLLIAAVPVVTPFLELQRLVPLLGSIRFPRLYPIAVLAVALGAAFPLAVARGWLADRRLAPLDRRVGLAAAAILLLGLLTLDASPYRVAYRISTAELDQRRLDAVAAWLAEPGHPGRVSAQDYGQPLFTETILAGGREVAVGWPHPMAAPGVWLVTGRHAYAAPEHARRAHALAGSALLVAWPARQLEDGERRVGGLRVAPTGEQLYPLRAYREAVVVHDDVLAADLAVALAPDGVSVVSGDRATAARLGGQVAGVLDAPDPCADLPPAAAAPRWLLAEAASACALQPWMDLPHDPSPGAERARSVGGTVSALVGGLAGVAVSLDRPPGPTRLRLHEVAAGGRLGPVLADVASAGKDRNGLWEFAFPPVDDAAGRTYAFVLSCPECGVDGGPRLRHVSALRATGDLLVDGRRDPERVTVSVPLYGRAPGRHDAGLSEVVVERPAAGRWTLAVDADEPALLVVPAAHFPGWTATVDGDPVEVLRANSGFLGVQVGPGPHEVQLSWTPPRAVALGRVVTGATLLLLAWLALVRRRGGSGPPM